MTTIPDLEDFTLEKLPVTFEELFGDLTIEDLPSCNDQNWQKLQKSFQLRREYIKELGFVLFSQNFAYELKNVLDSYDINTFLELEAGTGSFTILMNNLGFKGKGVTLPISDNHWGMSSESKYYQLALKEQWLLLSNLEEYTPDNWPDLIITSWTPYGGGQEVIQFMENLEKIPLYFLSIDEGRGGCVGSDDYFDWLEKNYMEIHWFDFYQHFSLIFDRPVLYKRKPNLVSNIKTELDPQDL